MKQICSRCGQEFEHYSRGRRVWCNSCVSQVYGKHNLVKLGLGVAALFLFFVIAVSLNLVLGAIVAIAFYAVARILVGNRFAKRRMRYSHPPSQPRPSVSSQRWLYDGSAVEAQYDGICAICNHAIRQGDEITWWNPDGSNTKWVHAECMSE